MNKVFLIGNLTHDPEAQTTQSGHRFCKFTLAVRRTEDITDFIPIVAWRKTAELCEQYLEKGKKAAVCGSMQTRSYDAADGTKRHVTEVQANEVEFLSPRQETAQREPIQAKLEKNYDDDLPF